jgi:hypothetical protein
MKILNLQLCTAIFVVAFLAVPADACRAPCRSEIVQKFQAGLAKKTKVIGKLHLETRTPIVNGEEFPQKVIGHIVTKDGKRHLVTFHDSGLIIIGCCPTHVLPSVEVEGTFYLSKKSKGFRTLVHWEDKYLTEPTDTEVEG